MRGSLIKKPSGILNGENHQADVKKNQRESGILWLSLSPDR